mgnify:CR=1 FL=1
MCTWDAIRHALKWSIRPLPLGLSILGIPLAAEVVQRAADAVECLMADGLEPTQNRFNS